MYGANGEEKAVMTVTPGDLVHSNHLRIQAFFGEGSEEEAFGIHF